MVLRKVSYSSCSTLQFELFIESFTQLLAHVSSFLAVASSWRPIISGKTHIHIDSAIKLGEVESSSNTIVI